MKVTYRIPGEMYAFVEVVEELGTDPTPEQIYERREELTNALKPRPINELPDKTFNGLLDNFLLEGTIVDGANLYEQCSPAQQNVLQQIKKAFKRLEAKGLKALQDSE